MESVANECAHGQGACVKTKAAFVPKDYFAVVVELRCNVIAINPNNACNYRCAIN
jgi:hypothetical protein